MSRSTLQNCPLWLYKLLPFLRWWPMVNRQSLKDDGIAGLTGALIVLPQGVAFATIAGMPPEYGLYAAMMPAIIAGLFGSSWHLVSGPTTAISIAVFASISPHADPGSPEFIGMVLTLTFLTGLFQLILGLARMGTLVNFISHTVVIGFTAGAAILIASSQIKNFFGISIPRGAEFYEVLIQLVEQADKINPYVTGVAAITLITGIISRRVAPKLPYMIVALLVGSIVAFVLNNMYGFEQTHIKTVGALPASVPPISHPDFSMATLKTVFFSSLIVTMLALTEAVSISRAIAGKSQQRIDGNQEFIGQGLSNLVGSFFSGYASSGSFNRSGVNYASGARTPLAAVFAAFFLLIILLAVAPLAAYLPTAAMAGVLFLVAWGLIDTHHIMEMPKISKQEAVVLWVTLIGTLLDLEKGIFLGIILSLVFYLYRTSRPAIHSVIPDASDNKRKFIETTDSSKECPQLKVMRINGSIFFGAVEHVQKTLTDVDEQNPTQKRVLLLSRGMNFIDASGADMLAQEADRRKKIGGALYLTGLKAAVTELLGKGEFMHRINPANVFRTKGEAFPTIYSQLDSSICRDCKVRLFNECQSKLPDGSSR